MSKNDESSKLVAVKMVCDIAEAYPRINPIWGPRGLEGLRPGRVREGQEFTYVGPAEDAPRDWAHAVDEDDAEMLAAAHHTKSIRRARERRGRAVARARDLAGLPQPELLEESDAEAAVPASPNARGSKELRVLRAEAASLGVRYAHNMKAETLRASIDEAKALTVKAQEEMQAEALKGERVVVTKPTPGVVSVPTIRPSDRLPTASGR